jgi:hypothetical protein
MADTVEELAELALRLLAESATIGDLDTDTSLAAKAIRPWYPRARKEVLRARAWSFANTEATLVLVETFDTASAQYLYSYRLPENCLQPVKLIDSYGKRNRRTNEEWAFKQRRDAASTAWASGTTYTTGQYASVTSGSPAVTTWYRALRETTADAPASSAFDWVAIEGTPPALLLCDLPDAILEYTADVTDPREFPPHFETALAARMAFYAALRLTKDEGTSLQARMGQVYELAIAEAEVTDSQGERPDPDPPSDFEAARL